MLDKTTGLEGSLKTVKLWSKEMWESNYTRAKKQNEQEDKGRKLLA